MTFPPAETGLIAQWMTSQRWYTNKGVTPRIEEIGRVTWQSDDDGVQIVTHLFLDHVAGKPALYQVPLTYRRDPLPDLDPVAEVDGVWIYDAPHDVAYSRALLEAINSERHDDGHSMSTDAEHSGSLSPSWATEAKVLTGEQSNTSIVIRTEDGLPVICKVFRAIHHGDNPDVELQSALAAAGFKSVPRSFGSISAQWPDSGRTEGRAQGHLVFAQEFLETAQDGWKVAVSAASNGYDFSPAAYDLGVATAEMHATLGSTFDLQPMSSADVAHVIAQMRGRLAAAIAEVPSLATLEEPLAHLLGRAAAAPWPALQRIHGDLHLGQVLDVPGRAWVIVDFEGEPLRPMKERRRLDSALRDVAGMLRSFDYVGGSLVVTGETHDQAAIDEWVENCRSAFVRGYADARGHDLSAEQAIVDAFEIDKALYETVYEVRNRPHWLPIPIAAITRLATRAIQS
jgi:trehalose synthase-fused probable maltokinase